jgi:diguanylate cyclase (GGDEF)-like protein
LRGQKPIGLIRLEVDGYNGIVDTYGSFVADILLKKIAELLRESVRVSDIACRVGDQEFVLVLIGISRDLTLERAEHLRVHAENIKLKYEDQIVEGISFVIGVVIYPEHGTTVDALLENAGTALRQAKSDKANPIVVYKRI